MEILIRVAAQEFYLQPFDCARDAQNSVNGRGSPSSQSREMQIVSTACYAQQKASSSGVNRDPRLIVIRCIPMVQQKPVLCVSHA